MCGIAGIYGQSVQDMPNDINEGVMCALDSRGPDDSGMHRHKNFCFYHTRLSIIDVTSRGKQPFRVSSSDSCLTFNGEIYNYLEIKSFLDKNYHVKWVSNSDTEVLFWSLLLTGIERTLNSINGMFAFAYYNAESSKLYIARDRAGEKPLYYSDLSRYFCFASNINALKIVTDQHYNVDSNSIQQYLSYGWIASPFTIYENIKALESGVYLSVSLDGSVEKRRYFDCRTNFLFDGKKTNNKDELIDRVDAELNTSINLVMRSDVSVGLFLSGGVDSSLILKKLYENGYDSVQTFSMAFSGYDNDESHLAAELVDLLGPKHHVVEFNRKYISSNIESIIGTLDQPFADPSYLPEYLLSKFASNYVKVCLTGDGADELFFGYGRYISILKLIERQLFVHKAGVGHLLYSVSESRIIHKMLDLTSEADAYGYLLALVSRSRADCHDYFLKSSKSISRFLPSYSESYGCLRELAYKNSGSVIRDIMNREFSDYLCNNIFYKTDLATMNNGLEARTPFVTSNMLNLIPVISDKDLYSESNGELKPILRSILRKKGLSFVSDRPKKGFGIPLSSMLRSDLSEWAGDYISCFPLVEGLCRNEVINLWNNYLKSKNNRSRLIWALVILSQYLNTHNDGR